MLNSPRFGKPFFHFFTLEFFKEKRKHAGVIAISVVILFLLSSVLFISSSIRYSLTQTLEQEPDFIIQRLQGGHRINAPTHWMNPLIDIPGVTKVSPRIYGRYFVKPKGISFLIIGVDFLDEQSHRALETLLGDNELKNFLRGGDQMLIGNGVSQYLNENFYEDHYKFLTPQGKFRTIKIFKHLPQETNLISNDMVILPIELARIVLGMHENEVTDISLNVPNEDEWDTVSNRISALHYDVRVTTKQDIAKAYKNLYNYKGGIFLMLFLVVIVTFVLILYQRYAMVFSDQKRSIGLLRALGWSIQDVLWLKFLEAITVVSTAFIVGTSLGYIYVFGLGAPLLSGIFLGDNNLNNAVSFVPILELGTLSTIFLIYAIPFIAAILIPVWKIAVTDPKEAML